MTSQTSADGKPTPEKLGILGAISLVFGIIGFLRLVRTSPQNAMAMSDREIEHFGFTRDQIPFISKHLRAAQ